MASTKNILVAPLDWGLGHATRCIPIIRELQAQGCQVFIAASGNHAALLQQEFPGLSILPLQGYTIRYSKGNLMLQLFRQLPRFIQTIRQENSWLQKAIREYEIDAVISDNRYGLYSPSIPCVLITHQLHVLAPNWLKWTERLAQKSIYRFIKNFSECWVPDDVDAKNSLAASLSHPKHKPTVPVKYIGWLTRFQPQLQQQTKKFRLLISLSGPEPQRTVLENVLLQQISKIEGQVLLIRGLPGNTAFPVNHLPNLSIVNHLPGTAMQQAIGEADIFLSRCGYSTLMDLQTVACRCIFIPTPGQTEQEYLGKEIAVVDKAVVKKQDNFDLKLAMQEVAIIQPFSSGTYQNKELSIVVKEWLKKL